MKNQYNVIKEKLEQGFFVLAKSKGGRFNLFSSLNEDSINCSDWQDTREEALAPYNFNSSLDREEYINEEDLEIVEYFRPNDLFPSKPFQVGDEVNVKADFLPEGMNLEIKSFLTNTDLYVHKVGEEDETTRAYGLRSHTKEGFWFVNERYVYPRIEKQEKLILTCGFCKANFPDGCLHDCEKLKRSPEEIIGEASKKALEDAGYIITKNN